MFDLSGMAEAWHKAVVYHGPDVQQELFVGKLSRLGAKAPFGSPAAKAQLAHAIAKAQIVNGGSGQFLGEPLNDHGTNASMAKAELMVGKNLPFAKANYIVEHAVGY
jgi:hypothetical protein